MSYINLGQVVWPIGSIYMSSQSTSPANIFGGTWSQLSDEKFLLPSTKYNNSGGEKTHTLSIEEMPMHSHTGNIGTNWNFEVSPGFNSGSYGAPGGKQFTTNDDPWEGSGQPHNNMPPYRTCYCWIRTA